MQPLRTMMQFLWAFMALIITIFIMIKSELSSFEIIVIYFLFSIFLLIMVMTINSDTLVEEAQKRSL